MVESLGVDTSVVEERDIAWTVRKMTYSDGRAYQYHISDEAGELRYVAKPTGLLLPIPTRLVEFFDTDRNPSGRLQPQDVAPWLRATHYELLVGEDEEEPIAVIQERWRLVDILLLRLPRYDVQFGENRYVIRGSRYGSHFYGIFRLGEEIVEEEPEEIRDIGLDLDLPEETEVEETEEAEDAGEEAEDGEEEEEEPKFREEKVGEIQRPTAGASYVVETDAVPLRQAPLLLASLVALIDMELYA